MAKTKVRRRNVGVMRAKYAEIDQYGEARDIGTATDPTPTDEISVFKLFAREWVFRLRRFFRNFTLEKKPEISPEFIIYFDLEKTQKF